MRDARRPPTIGVNLWPQDGTWVRLRDAAVAADRAGVDSVWTWDHLYAIEGAPCGSSAAEDEDVWLGPPERIAERWRPFFELGEMIERWPEVRALLAG